MVDRESILPLLWGAVISVALNLVAVPLLVAGALDVTEHGRNERTERKERLATQQVKHVEPRAAEARKAEPRRDDESQPERSKPEPMAEKRQPDSQKEQARKEDEIPLGSDDGVDKPTTSWISYDDFQKLVAPKGSVTQAGQQDQEQPHQRAPLDPDPSKQLASASQPPMPPGVPVPPSHVPSHSPPTNHQDEGAPAKTDAGAVADADSGKTKSSKPTQTAEPKPGDAEQTDSASPPKPDVKPKQAKTTPPKLEDAADRPDFKAPAKADRRDPMGVTDDPTGGDRPNATPSDTPQEGEKPRTIDGDANKDFDEPSADPGSPTKEESKQPDDDSSEAKHQDGQPKPVDEPREQDRGEPKDGVDPDSDAGQSEMKTVKPRPDDEADAKTPRDSEVNRADEASPDRKGDDESAEQSREKNSNAKQPKRDDEAEKDSPRLALVKSGAKPQPPVRTKEDGDDHEKPKPTSLPRTDAASDASSDDEDFSTEVKPGRVVTQKGLRIRTAHPELTVAQRVFATPGPMRVALRFDTNGTVKDVNIVQSSGWRTIDDSIVASLYKWRAEGEFLKQQEQPFWRRFTIVFR